MKIFRNTMLWACFCMTLVVLGVFFLKSNGSNGVYYKSHELDEIFENKKTVCFGRFLIDVPFSALVVYGPAEAPVPIEIIPESAEQFSEVLKNKLSEIEGEKEFSFGDLKNKDSMLGTIIDGQRKDQKIIFGIRKSTGDDYQIYSYLKDKGKVFLTRMFSGSTKPEYQKAVNRLNEISRLISARSDVEIPLPPGICIDGGFVAESRELTHESVTLGIRLMEFPDVHFSISTTMKSSLVESDALEPRLLRAEEEAKFTGNGNWYSRIKVFRRGETKIDSWVGYQILARKPPQDGQKESYEFAFLSQGEPKNPYLPVLDIKLHSGVVNNRIAQVKPRISDEEAIKLWDRLTQSIRRRPTS